MRIFEYDINSAVNYAQNWAYKRNPNYYNFDRLGGDCTNFISQCIHAGARVMNYDQDNGWYYNSLNDRAPAWTGVGFLGYFLLNNKRIGPFARLTTLSSITLGDVIQLYKKGQYYHSLIVTGFNNQTPLVSAHTKDGFNIPLSTYSFERLRCLHIEGVRK